MKHCSQCKQSKDLSEFSKNIAKPDGLQAICKTCMKVIRKNHYQANKAATVKKSADRRRMLVNMVWAYKSQHPCVDCGESNPVVLDFDHIRDKKFGISAMCMNGNSWERISEEIEKCEVVCSNCHRVRTFDRGEWKREDFI